jgi:hypothetical protein
MRHVILLPFYIFKLCSLLISYYSDLLILKNSKNYKKDLARYKSLLKE